MNESMTLAQSVSSAAWRAMHSFWLDAMSRQEPSVWQRILTSMGNDASGDNWFAHVNDPDGCWHVVRRPSGGEIGRDVYEIRLRAVEEEIPMVHIAGANLGLVDAYLPGVEVELDDEALETFLGGESPSGLSEA